MSQTEFYIKEIGEGHEHIKINVSGVDYSVIFNAQPSANIFEEDDVINLIKNCRLIYTVVFVVSEYIECDDYNGDLYARPNSPQPINISILKQKLQYALWKHYQHYQPECYVFMGDSKGLTQLYRKMCLKPAEFLLDFETITGLGQNSDHFVIKTPKFIK